MTKTLRLLLISGASCAFLTACGGGGSSSSSTSTTPTTGGTDTTPVYQAGTFESASTFKGQCETPRTSVGDVSGSELIEKFWLRSWTDETYLWYNEVTDRDPNSIADRLDYFEELKTARSTASGNAVDQFHFSIDSEEYEASQAGEASAGYGARILVLAGSPPRDIRIPYTQPDGPASEEGGFLRGDKILVVNGVDAVNGGSTQAEFDLFLEGLLPTVSGVEHSFTVLGADGAERNVTLTSADVVEQPVTATSVLDTADGNKVGYIHFTTFSPFSSEEAIVSAMEEMEDANVTDLVLDLRYNGGGLLAVASQVGFMVAGDTATDGKTFDLLTFNDKHTVTDPVTGRALEPTPFYSTSVGFSLDAGDPLPELNLERVFILSTGSTCSASEAVINGLRGIDIEVILIGTQTCGKPYGFYGTDNCGETYFTVQFRGANDKGFGDYADGFLPNDAAAGFGEEIPGCTIADEYQGALGDADEPFLAAALKYADDGSCPTTATVKPTAEKTQITYSNGLDIMDDPRFAFNEFLRTSRIIGITDGEIEGNQ